jgi:DNA-binding CsgD family transcriptional regulator
MQGIMLDERRVLAAIHRLYDAATDAGKWAAFLQEMASAFDANGAHLLRVNPRQQALSFSVLHGYDDFILETYGRDGADLRAALAQYEKHFSELMATDPRIRLLEQYPSRPISCRLAIDERELHGSKMYQDQLRHADVEYSLCVSLPEDDGSLIMMGVFRGKQSTFFTQHDVEMFGELIPHVKRAVAMTEHLARIDFGNRVALEALDRVGLGMFLVDADARLVHANAKAREIVALKDGIFVHNDTLTVRSKGEQELLRRSIWSAVAQVHTGHIPAGQAMAVSRPSANEPFPVLVATLWGNHLRYGLSRLDRPLAIVFVTVPEEPLEAPAEVLRRVLGLTPAEARVCERLVSGGSVEDAARGLDISVQTVRDHLKSVFAKTGVKRQAELVAKILATPAWLRNHIQHLNGGLQAGNPGPGYSRIAGRPAMRL